MSAGMEIRIVPEGPVPVYQQIVDALRAMCVSGKLEPGMKLPSVRELAASLGVHHNTAARAYRTLEADGWVQIAGRRGVLVEYRHKPAAPDDDARRREGQRLRHLIAELRGKGFSDRWIVMEVNAVLEPEG